MTRTQYYRELVRDLVEGSLGQIKVIRELTHIIQNLLSSYHKKLHFQRTFNFQNLTTTTNHMATYQVFTDHAPITGHIKALKADETETTYKAGTLQIINAQTDPPVATITQDPSNEKDFTVTPTGAAGAVDLLYKAFADEAETIPIEGTDRFEFTTNPNNENLATHLGATFDNI